MIRLINLVSNSSKERIFIWIPKGSLNLSNTHYNKLIHFPYDLVDNPLWKTALHLLIQHPFWQRSSILSLKNYKVELAFIYLTVKKLDSNVRLAFLPSFRSCPSKASSRFRLQDQLNEDLWCYRHFTVVKKKLKERKVEHSIPKSDCFPTY